jgi:sugar phosphate isomerase/epimerase
MITRRNFLSLAAAPLAAAPAPTRFQIACMTLPYAAFPWPRALAGIARSGYRYVAWGTTHQQREILEAAAPAAEARSLAAQCRDLNLQPVLMFSRVYVGAPDSVPVHTARLRQASAARLPFVLTFGHIEKGGHATWIRNLKTLGPIARAEGVTLVIKQHGGNTATGADCARIVEEVADEGVKMFYDAGNVLDYNNDDPIPDIRLSARHVRGFCIKDHRNTPKDEDCAIGYGEIDHYKLLAPVLNTGLTMPLACENIALPLLPRPTTPEGVDDLARRSREYLEALLAGLSASGPAA